MRAVLFHPRARDSVRAFPRTVRDRLSKLLYLLQAGESLGMPVSRPMPIVGRGVSELRVQAVDSQFRAFYLVSDPRGILVFHAFVKKTQETPGAEIDTAIRRLKEMLDE